MNLNRVGRWGWWLAAIATALVLGVAIFNLLRPWPARHIVFATGPEGSAYAVVGARYREILARDGVDLRLRPTAGAVENLALLRDPRSGVSAGFVQAGVSPGGSSDLVSLGAVFYEPLWFFRRGNWHGTTLSDMFGHTLSIGPEGSGTRALALELLAMNDVDRRRLTLLPLLPEQAAAKLRSGEIDGALMLTSWDSPTVRALIASADVDLVPFPRADAYVALKPYLNKLTVPMGVGNLGLNRPPADVTLLAPKASLVTRTDLHPALQYLLISAAFEANSGPSIFNPPGAFPSPDAIDIPLGPEARHYYKSGPSLLQRHLPFWLADLVERLMFVLLPVVGVLYPLWSLLPRAWDWYMRRQIYSLYGELKLLEKAFVGHDAGAAPAALFERLASLERRATDLRVTAPYAAIAYHLRAHIRQVAATLREGSRP